MAETGPSRRDFLKLAGLAVVFPFIGGANRLFSEYGGERYQYTGDDAEIIKRVKRDFQVDLVSPMPWTDGTPNMPFSGDDLTLVDTALELQPDAYKHTYAAPSLFLLHCDPNSTSDGAIGNLVDSRVDLSISKAFNPTGWSMEEPAGSVYKYPATQFVATIMNELTQAYVSSRPELMDKWAEVRGWKKVGPQEWHNSRADRLLHEFDSDTNPYKDLGFSVGRCWANFDSLSSESQEFFLATEPWASWTPVLEWKQNNK